MSDTNEAKIDMSVQGEEVLGERIKDLIDN